MADRDENEDLERPESDRHKKRDKEKARRRARRLRRAWARNWNWEAEGPTKR